MNVRRTLRLLGLLLLLLGVSVPTSAAAGGGAPDAAAPVETATDSRRTSDERVIAPAASLRVGQAATAVGRRADDGPVPPFIEAAVAWSSEARDFAAWLDGEAGSIASDSSHLPRPERAPPAA